MMDLTTLCLFCFVSFTLIDLSQESSTSSDCRQCKPGYFASRLCSETHDTICSPCGQGTFTSHYNHFQSCSKCSNCEGGEFVSKPCSLLSDTVCKACSAVSKSELNSFLRDCVQSDSPYSLSQLSDETIKLKGDKTRKAYNIDHNINIYEGSGVSNFEEKNIVHESSEEIIEGSGEVHIESDTAATTNQTTLVPVVIIPDETEDKVEDIIIKATDSNVTHISTTESFISTKSTTTTKEGVVLIDSGIWLGNQKQKLNKTDVVFIEDHVKPDSSHITSTIRSTTVREIVIEQEEGIVLKSESENSTKGFRSREGDVINVSIKENFPSDDPQFGASKAKASSTDSSGISVGLFIAVCIICAAVFFVLGLMVNKYWGKRRARSFNVEQAEKQNGQTFQDHSKIEFKDPENMRPTKTGIYDEIPADKQNGTEAHIKSATADPVYSKPVKRQSSNTGSKANTESTGDVDKLKAPAPEKPVNEARYSRHSASIKFIDEEQTEEETDKLLPQQPGQDEQVKPNTSEASNNNTNENEEELATEITPMISVDNDTVNV